MQACIVIECKLGTMKKVGQDLERLNGHSGYVKVLSSDTVMGPYDVIVKLEGPDLHSIGSFVVNVIQRLRGVEWTQTLMVRTAD